MKSLAGVNTFPVFRPYLLSPTLWWKIVYFDSAWSWTFPDSCECSSTTPVRSANSTVHTHLEMFHFHFSCVANNYFIFTRGNTIIVHIKSTILVAVFILCQQFKLKSVSIHCYLGYLKNSIQNICYKKMYLILFTWAKQCLKLKMFTLRFSLAFAIIYNYTLDKNYDYKIRIFNINKLFK